ncbi:MAG: glutamyl-tRNA reductase [Bacteroidetes bacterium]|nr:glutamyl-tRNA reductase [Bacteroidota bacterium]MBU1717860.1 glutamyl-tRNA reductase [Bacteroidota bacterium]
MHCIVVGVNHQSAGVDIREKLHFPLNSLCDALSKLRGYQSIEGSVILSTCNRVEIYASVSHIEQGFDDIIDFIGTFHQIPVEKFHTCLYKKNCQFAVSHLFKVASGLDSMVVGEYQIQGQVRDAYNIAKEYGAPNGMLNKLFQTAIHIGKRVRSQTMIGNGSVSVATMATEIIRQMLVHEQKLKLLLIGAGEIATCTATSLQQYKTCQVTVSNRSQEKAIGIADTIRGSVCDFEKRYEEIVKNDVIIVSTSADDYVIKKTDLDNFQSKLSEKMIVFIDLSIPRNVDPAINSLDNAMVYSIDDLHRMVDVNKAKRCSELGKAEEIIDSVSQEYYEWYAKQFIIPAMQEIKKELKVVRDITIASYKSAIEMMEWKQQEMVGEMLDAYSDKLIKVIMTNLKRATTKEDMISITRTLKETFTIE